MANQKGGTYSETILATFHDGTVAYKVEALLDSVDVDMGDKESEYKPNLAGGRIKIQKPQEDTIITFEGWFQGIGDTDSTTPDGLVSLYAGTTADTTNAIQLSVDRTRRLFNVFLLWTDDTAATSAQDSIASGANMIRLRASNSELVSMKPKYSDGELKWTFKFRVPAFSPSGSTKNIYWESVDGTSAMTSLASQ